MKQGMISIYLAQAIRNKVIKVTGSLTRYRDFIFIDDVVSALSMIDALEPKKTLNLGTGIRTDVNQLLKLLIYQLEPILESSIKVIELPSHSGDVMGATACIDEILSTGWYPKCDLNTGLKYMIEDALKTLHGETL
jgi:UDP-glucose 4-epimerase